ncbi:hypothetical protein PI23P_04257 [Polaribacter irgensii 23-P]|uniref:Uncharacterized protein n=1 Tax=Polaribacter irgensii 23-P TaxID=313594 RepID=A4BXI8_9FLAO|nr:hypothetical protein PI23P_04257 [Polaribacter irgensii 23-P]
MEKLFIKKNRTRSLPAINTLLQLFAEINRSLPTALLKNNHHIISFINFSINLKRPGLAAKKTGYFLKLTVPF